MELNKEKKENFLKRVEIFKELNEKSAKLDALAKELQMGELQKRAEANNADLYAFTRDDWEAIDEELKAEQVKFYESLNPEQKKAYDDLQAKTRARYSVGGQQFPNQPK